MISIKQQQNLLLEIARRLPKEMAIYAVGGTAMMFLGLKEATLDIDLVFTNREDRKIFREIAKSLGYQEMDHTIVYGTRNNCPEMIHLGDARLDLFLTNVIDFEFSEEMQKRAQQLHQFDKNLKIKIADVQDIIVMKCATNRAKDEEDIINLIKNTEIKWDILINEALNQVRLGKETAIMSLGTLLERLKNKQGLNIPKEVIDKLFSLLKEQVNNKQKSP